MACCEVLPGVHVCRPNGQWERVQGRRRKRFWCFNCRKHLMHTRMRFRHAEPSYYDDWFEWRCPKCDEEHVLFPGWEWKDPYD